MQDIWHLAHTPVDLMVTPVHSSWESTMSTKTPSSALSDIDLFVDWTPLG